MTVYVKVSRDRYRWIEAMADTVPELARMVGTKADNIYSALSHGHKTYEKIEIDEEDV